MIAAQLLGTGGAVLVFIIVFSALASSLDSLLAATSDLILEDVYRKHFRPEASRAHLRRVSSFIIVGLGIFTWLLSLPNIDTLGRVLHLTGAFVASTIWPIAAGLYWRKTNPIGATLAMVFGSALGLLAYFWLGFYVAALVGAAVSMTVVIATTVLFPREFRWEDLKE